MTQPCFSMSRHDISDEKWAIIGPMLAKADTETRGRKRKDDRLIFNAILWIMKTGAVAGLASGVWALEHST